MKTIEIKNSANILRLIEIALFGGMLFYLAWIALNALIDQYLFVTLIATIGMVLLSIALFFVLLRQKFSMCVISSKGVYFYHGGNLYKGFNWSEIEQIRVVKEFYAHFSRWMQGTPLIGYTIKIICADKGEDVKLFCFPFSDKLQIRIIREMYKVAKYYAKPIELEIEESFSDLAFRKSIGTPLGPFTERDIRRMEGKCFELDNFKNNKPKK